MQVLGGRGYMENNFASQILRDARALSVGEGPNEGLTMHVGRSEQLTGAVTRFLREQLGASEVADRLAQAVPQIVRRCEQASYLGGRAERGQWAQALIGRLSTDAVLLAIALREVNSPNVTAWAEASFETSLRDAVQGTKSEPLMLSPSQVVTVASNLVHTIGDVEQELPGEDATVDSLLRKDDASKSPLAKDRPIATAGSSAQSNGAEQHTDQASSSDEPTSRQSKQRLLAKLLQKRN
jgi:hypothetical protein